MSRYKRQGRRNREKERGRRGQGVHVGRQENVKRFSSCRQRRSGHRRLRLPPRPWRSRSTDPVQADARVAPICPNASNQVTQKQCRKRSNVIVSLLCAHSTSELFGHFVLLKRLSKETYAFQSTIFAASLNSACACSRTCSSWPASSCCSVCW